MSIFVSIAAYRDPELGPTLCDCIARARWPEALRFGICWQHGEEEAPLAEFADPRMRVREVPWRESRGACWARAEVMRMWDGEEFFLQIDSHHRFVQDWDAILLAEAERSGAAKPVLTTYVAPFDPTGPRPAWGEPMRMDFHQFTADGIPLFRPAAMAAEERGRPLRARFVSGHFLFTPGRFVADVPYDPELYFHGEEITLAIRAFTHGYALFHPGEHVLWHEYTRLNRRKHWDDHVRAQGIVREWHQCDASSRAKVRHFLATGETGRFGCGTERSLAEYEAYAGLSFRHRAAQDATLRGSEPPNPPAPPCWPTETREWRVRIMLDRAALPEAALREPRFWYVGVHDAKGEEIHRADSYGEELSTLASWNDAQAVIERRFQSARQPASWTVWPVSGAGAWLDKLTGSVDAASLLPS